MPGQASGPAMVACCRQSEASVPKTADSHPRIGVSSWEPSPFSRTVPLSCPPCTESPESQAELTAHPPHTHRLAKARRTILPCTQLTIRLPLRRANRSGSGKACGRRRREGELSGERTTGCARLLHGGAEG